MRSENKKERRLAKTVELRVLETVAPVAPMTLVSRAEWRAEHRLASILENDRTERATIEIPCIG